MAANAAFELFRAASAGSAERMLEIVGATRDPDTHFQALRWAVEKGLTDVVRHLLVWDESEADPAADESFVLWEAVRLGNLAAVRLLAEDGRADATAALAGRLGDLDDPVDLDVFREIFAFLFEAGALEFNSGLVVEFVLGCHGWVEDSALEAYADAAYETGKWRLDDSWFDDRVTYGAAGISPAAGFAYLGFVRLTRYALRDPRARPRDFVAGWKASASDSWYSDIDPGGLADHRRLAILEELLACPGRRELLLTCAGHRPRDLRLLVLLAVEDVGGPGLRNYLEGSDLREFLEGVPIDRTEESRVGLGALARAGDWTRVRRLLVAALGPEAGIRMDQTPDQRQTPEEIRAAAQVPVKYRRNALIGALLAGDLDLVIELRTPELAREVLGMGWPIVGAAVEDIRDGGWARVRARAIGALLTVATTPV